MTYIIEGVVEGLFLGVVDSRVSRPTSFLDCAFDGLVGDRHYGATRISGKRDAANSLAQGLPIRNDRQWSMLSVEELAAIANALHVSKVFPKDLGGNILVSGIPSLTTLPPNTVYSLGSALLLSAGENLPCRLGGEATAERYGDPSLATAFSQSALGLRGQVGSVLEPGVVMIRDSIRVYPPDFFR